MISIASNIILSLYNYFDNFYLFNNNIIYNKYM